MPKANGGKGSVWRAARGPALLLAVGLSVALAAGSYLAYRGAVGRCPVKAALIENGMIGSDRQVASRMH